MKRRRCLIPADGFYEWKPIGARKQPYYVHAKHGGPIAFAGLWETWTGPNGEELETAAIVTTRANRTLAPIHDRMPVIVAPAQFDLWLDNANVEPVAAAALIKPAPDDLLEAIPVSTDVNRPANDNPKLVEQVDEIVEAEMAAKSARKATAKRVPAKPPKKTNGPGVLF
jgi:putative SOS response-associated peptidase YedK